MAGQASGGAVLFDEAQILVSRVFDAPRALVFKLWSDPAHIVHWWGPQGFVNTACELDFHVGGSFRLEMRGPDGSVYPCQGVYREIIEPERIVFLGVADEHNACGAGLPPEALVTIDFAEHEGKTTLTLRASLKSAKARAAAVEMGFVRGWNDSLDRLAELLTPS